MALKPVYAPEAAARILWHLILTDRARIDHFDTPAPGYQGDPANHRNLAREFSHLQHDPDVIKKADEYRAKAGAQPLVQAAPDPRDFDANPGSPVQRGEPQLHVQGEERESAGRRP